MGRKIYISLGTGKNQLPLIQAARKQKFKIIGIDQDSLSPGMEYCDYRIVESIINYRKILYKISTLWYDGEIEGGYCASYGKALLSWSYLAEKFRLPGTARPLAEALLDKYEVRKRLSEVSKDSGIFKQPLFMVPGPAFNVKTPLPMEFPIIIKPRSGWAKSDIKTLDSRSELNRALKLSSSKSTKADKKGKSFSKMILEEKIEGDEITVCGIIQDFKFLLLCVSDKITASSDPFIELEHVFPSKYYNLEQQIINSHQLITETLQITDTPIVSEWKIKNGDLYLIEISLQVPGEFIGSFIIPEAVRYDFFGNLVNITSGKKLNRKVKKRKFKKGIVRFYPEKLDPEEEKLIRKKAKFFQILNENPEKPPKSNHDRYAVAGFIG